MTFLNADSARRFAALVAGGAACLTLTVAGPAQADRATDAPVTRNDRVTVPGAPAGLLGGPGRPVEVLANDSDPNGDELAICRVQTPANAPLLVFTGDGLDSGFDSATATATGAAPAEGTGPKNAPRTWSRRAGDSTTTSLYVAAMSNRAGTYTVRYWACDFDYLTPATLTVTVKPTKQVKVKVLPGRHKIRFTNPFERPIRVVYGSPREIESRDGMHEFRLAPGRSKTIDVERRRLFWVAEIGRGRTTRTIGIDFIRGLRP